MIIKNYSRFSLNKSFLPTLSNKDLTIKELLNFVNHFHSKKKDLDNKNGFNNISINININNNDSISPGGESPKFTVKI